MNISQVRVQNYKIVRDSGWVNIDEQITTLIGKNESGKTSILEAIASFSTNSAYRDEDLHNMKKYPNKERIPVISIRFEIEGDDPVGYQQLCEDSIHGDLIQFTKYADGTKRFDVDLDYEEMAWKRGKCVYSVKIRIDQLERWLENANTNTGNLKSDLPEIDSIVFDNPHGIYSELNNSKKELENKEMNENSDLNSINNYLIRELEEIAEEVDRVESDTVSIFENLVEIQYYDDIEMIDDKVDVDELNQDEHEALLKLFKSHDIDLEKKDEVDKGELARTISDDINRDISDAINNIWGQKSVDLEIDLIDDTIVINLRDVSVRAAGDDNTGGISARSVDRPSGPLSERSRGYKWFIAFYLNYSSDLSGTNQDLLLLFDDPAVYLHPKGKRDWLDAIEDVSEKSQIVYSSHSPFLISKEYPERLRMVEDIGEKNGNHGT
jgi:predicted ATP-dependent endonuclease of OLD family